MDFYEHCTVNIRYFEEVLLQKIDTRNKFKYGDDVNNELSHDNMKKAFRRPAKKASAVHSKEQVYLWI